MKTVIMILGLVIVCLSVGFAAGYIVHSSSRQTELALPEEVADIAKNMTVTVRESDIVNRNLSLDTSNWYCKATIVTGGSSPEKWDLADPNGKIVFYLLEDVADSTKADNYGDLIIRMNPIIENGTRKMVVVFYAEGGYDKIVSYGNRTLFHYSDIDPESNYGISLINIP